MYKGKIINFELLHTNNYSIIVDEIIQARSEGHDAIIGLLLMDGFAYKNNSEFFENMQAIQTKVNELGFKKVVLVPGICEDFKKVLETHGIWFDIVHFDFWQAIVYQSYKDIQLPEWNKHTDKFLFLGGIPSRYNRICLLSKFYERQLLDRSEWTFFAPWDKEDIEWCRSALSHYSESEYNTFLSKCERSIDVLYKDAKQYSKATLTNLKESFNNQWCRDPAYINVSTFSTTSLSVISEGNVYEPATDRRYLTEKTWRTVLNKHPFIMAGYVEQSQYARTRGLRTFNQYMLFPDYDLITDDNLRLEAIVMNTEYFLNTLEHNFEQIMADIEHNYQVFESVTEYNNAVLDNFKTEFQISTTDITKWFEQKSFLHLMRVLDAE